MESLQSYFNKCSHLLPQPYTSMETSSASLVYFCLSGLDLCNSSINESSSVIDWIYSLQEENGFLPSVLLTRLSSSSLKRNNIHLAATYSCLNSLLILKDDLSRVNKSSILESLSTLQMSDGSFIPSPGSQECDMRFVFCACAVAFILNDFSTFDIQLTIDYILKSQSYDGGIGQGPCLESHGGSTYCAVASLSLLEIYLQKEIMTPVFKEKVISWCVRRQISGFQGRVGKNADTCYAFWIGATLQILNATHLIDKDLLVSFLESTKSSYGGFGKEANDFPDLLHSYLGLAGLCIFLNHPDELDGRLNLRKQLTVSLSSSHKRSSAS